MALEKASKCERKLKSMSYFINRDKSNSFFETNFFWVGVYGVMFLVFIILKIQVFNLDQEGLFPDTRTYALVADAPLFQKAFWAHMRPFTYPLILKVFGIRGDFYLIPPDAFEPLTIFQMALAIICWATLGITITWTVRVRWLKPIAFLVIILFALCLDISQWDKIILTESTSASFFALFIAFLIAGSKIWKEANNTKLSKLLIFSFGFLLVSILFAFTRDLNGYLLLMCTLIVIIGSITLIFLRHSTSLFLFAIASLMLMIFFTQNLSANKGRRWLAPFWNVFYARILSDETALSFFVREGLPLDTETQQALQELDRQGFIKWRDDLVYKPLIDWVSVNGKSTYIKLLLINPLHSMRLPIDYTHQLISPDSSEYRKPTRPTPRWLSQMSNIIYPKTTEYLLIGLLILGILTLITSWVQFLRPWWLIPWFLLLTAYPLMFIIYHFDAIELERHAMQVALQLRLAGWMMLVYLLDAWVPNSDPKATF